MLKQEYKQKDMHLDQINTNYISQLFTYTFTLPKAAFRNKWIPFDDTKY